MNQLVSPATRSLRASFQAVPVFEMARAACWVLSLAALCFAVPEVGLKEYGYAVRGWPVRSYAALFPTLWVVSLLPLVAAIEVWGACRLRALHLGGLGAFLGLTALSVCVAGYGLPAAYFGHLLPSFPAGPTPATPLAHLMIGLGIVLWLSLFAARGLVRERHP